jgi:ABC-type transport system substrate-binding protein
MEFNTKGNFASVYSNREKVALAIDAVRILRDSYWGEGTVTETLLRPGSWYKEEPTKNYGYDAEKAANMLAVGSSTVRLLYDETDPVLTAAAETIKIQLEAAGLKVQMKTAGSYDIALRRERMTLMKAAEVIAKQDLLAAAGEEDQIRLAAEQLDVYMSEELTVYNLFFLTQGTVTGYGVEGKMTPGDWNVYNGIEELYMQTIEKETEKVKGEQSEGGAVQ